MLVDVGDHAFSQVSDVGDLLVDVGDLPPI
jgi:hypothetical protein